MKPPEYRLVDEDAELWLVGCCLFNPEAVELSALEITEKMLASDRCRAAMAAVRSLAASGQEVNQATVLGEMARRNTLAQFGRTWISDLIRDRIGLAVTGTYRFYADIIARNHRARVFMRRLNEAYDNLGDDELDPDGAVSALVTKLMDDPELRAPSQIATVARTISDGGWERMETYMENPRVIPGVPTGNATLDAYLGGFAPGRLIALGADTGVGKSLYVQHVACSLAKARVPVLVISTEMSNEEVMSRLAHMEAGWDRLAAYRAGSVTVVQRDSMLTALDALAGRPLFLCESRGMDAGQIGAEIRRQVRQHGVKVVVLDLLNGVPVKADNRAQGIGAVTAALKSVAQAEGVCILMVAHINRDSAKLGELGLHSFKDSSAIEQDADQAMLLVPMADGVRLSREETQARIEASGMVDVMFRVVKNRFGSEGAVPMVLNWRLGGRFYAREKVSA